MVHYRNLKNNNNSLTINLTLMSQVENSSVVLSFPIFFPQPIPSRPLSLPALNATIVTCFRDLCVTLGDVNDPPAQKPKLFD